MDFFSFFTWINEAVLAIPATLLFFGVGVVLTLKTGFLQFRGFPRFIRLLTSGIKGKGKFDESGEKRTINPFHALFAAMSTTIGMGSIVGPSVAIMAGGPGALFWMIVYIFFGAATKFTEVAFALHTRIQSEDGRVIGGPMQYLYSVNVWLARWYGAAMIFLFAGWCSLQSNTLATIYAQESVPKWGVGLGLAVLSWLVLNGGAQRVGALASKLVPFMFVLYISCSLFILLSDLSAFVNALALIAHSILRPVSALGGFFGATIFQAMRAGMHRGVFITEAGLGTSSIPHAVADTKNPIDQGLLAMFSGIADIILSFLSGMLVLVTGVWISGDFRSTLIYEAFKLKAPAVAQVALLISISLFIITTVIGNSFNGSQSFASMTNNRGTKLYMMFLTTVIFLGALMPVPLIWAMMDTISTFVAVPNLIGILILAFRKPHVIKC
jgi:AGCS family alanine or glycine:cation symporter